MHSNIKNICCIGAGFVGGPSMAVFADNLPNIKFIVLTNRKKIADWNNENLDKLPVYEPGLSELIDKNRNKNLFLVVIRRNIYLKQI